MILTNESGWQTKIDLDALINILPEETTFLEIPQILGIGLNEFLTHYGLTCEQYINEEPTFMRTNISWFAIPERFAIPQMGKCKNLIIYDDKNRRIYYESERLKNVEYYIYDNFKLTGMLKKVSVKQLLNDYGKYRRND